MPFNNPLVETSFWMDEIHLYFFGSGKILKISLIGQHLCAPKWYEALKGMRIVFNPDDLIYMVQQVKLLFQLKWIIIIIFLKNRHWINLNNILLFRGKPNLSPESEAMSLIKIVPSVISPHLKAGFRLAKRGFREDLKLSRLQVNENVLIHSLPL